MNDLQSRFPEMKPLKSTPALARINGIGVGMYGRRDFDPPTGTYVKTRWICVVFIPIFPLDSYRVADAQGGGWYFFGREKSSSFIRGARWCVVLGAAALFGVSSWNAHLQSPEYRMKQGRAAAKAQVEAGKPLEAVETYHGMLQKGWGNPAEWRQEMATLLDTEIDSGNPAQVEAAIRMADKKRLAGGPRALVPDLADRTVRAAGQCSDPATAATLLSAFEPTPTDLPKVHAALRKSLEDLHKAKPEDEATRIKLALLREEVGEVEGALELLEPAKDHLADGEGARLYGSLLMDAGRETEAVPHLERYVGSRQVEWKKAETALERTSEHSRKQAIAVLNRGEGPPGFRARYEKADETEQIRMVEEYLAERVERDPGYHVARQRYQAAAKIARPTMDLGVARLRLAQASNDAAERANLLKKAEEAFLTLQSLAGESDEYRLFLGQVYFWSSRETEGRKLFDELLEANKRKPETLLGLARIFRDLGESNDARSLLDEAYPKATNDELKSMIAEMRAFFCRNNDEEIEWLSKAPVKTPVIISRLAKARGEKAEIAGDLKAAAGFYREALKGYEASGRDSASLNNSALLYRSLYRLEGKPEDFETSARLLSEAVELEPANSILSSNAGESLLVAAVLRVVGDRVDPKLLQFDSSLDALRFLYAAEAEKAQVVADLKADPNFRKSLVHYWNSILLAPKNRSHYSWGAELFDYLDDTESLEKLRSKAAEQEFDFSTDREEFAKHLKKEHDTELRTRIKGGCERADKLLASLQDPRARGMAQSVIADARLSPFSIGEATDAAKWLADLRKAAKETPSSRLQSSLESALEVAALEKLAAMDPACAAIIEADRRLLSPGEIIRLLVRAKGQLGDKIRKEPLVVEAREAAATGQKTFPGSFSFHDWVIVDGLHPEQDAVFHQLAAKNDTHSLATRLQRELQRDDEPTIILEDYWQKLFDGDSAGAAQMLPKLEQIGIKLPPLS
ncbi:hypothetical protein [Haloferula sp. BvORR071]|uniref:tetratricopeptide repeat protein n=1 Tax=Haloferula sp. BvORR071 TaxID=1396141 RepID=UPI000558F2C8|nr:hypothetical protein [Haloferula sp. BvORR071]